MDPVKIENFEKTHAGARFPSFRHLGSEESQRIRTAVASRLRLPADSKGTSVLDEIRRRSQRLSVEPEAADDDFKLDSIFWRAGITPTERLYLNWYRFDDIDEIPTADGVRYFSDIWYPGADDLEVFDETLTWVISVPHDGSILLTRLRTDSVSESG